MVGPRIGGGSSRSGGGYVKPDTRPLLSTVEEVWPGCYRIARRYTALLGNGKQRAIALSALKLRIIECLAEQALESVEVGYVAVIAHDLIHLSDNDGVRLS